MIMLMINLKGLSDERVSLTKKEYGSLVKFLYIFINSSNSISD